jgi:hypothetical protein
MPFRLAIRLSALFLRGIDVAAGVDFAKDVYPVLRRSCFECHGHEVQKGDLRLDDEEHALSGGASGPVIVAADAVASEILRRVSLPRTDKEAMPRRGKPLTAKEIASLREWIDKGANWPEGLERQRHWSYQQPAKSPLPEVQRREWPRNEVDHFVLARMEEAGLPPSRQADTATLVRRLYLSLIGLPPPVEEVKRLEKLGNPLPQREIESLVDRLLQSEEFGVRWARPWLDLARYADSHGFQRDDLRDIWAFRDWVVDALNADMPFTRFTIEQVAGDLLPNPTIDQLVATGFHRCTPTNVEAGTEPEESRVNQVLDRVNTTGAVWLGTTLECAQCHDHKYDPFSMEDYYRLLAYFNNTEMEADRANPKVPGSIKFNGSPFDLEDTPNPERKKLETQLAKLEGEMTKLKGSSDAEFEAWLEQMSEDLQKPVREVPLEVIEFTSDKGAKTKELSDGSVLLVGKAADKDTYEITLQGAAKEITGIKLETLTHDSLPGKGPGRGDAKRPNFVLNHFGVKRRVADANDDPGKSLKLVDATADFSQKNYEVGGAIDDAAKSGWAINPQFGKSHWAEFEFAQPTTLNRRIEWVVSLVQDFGGGRSIGRVRISALTGSLAARRLPASLAAAIRKPAEERSDRELASLHEHFELEMPRMKALRREMASVEKELAALRPPTTEVMKELAEPRMTHLFKRGVYSNPGDKVQAGTPEILPQLKADRGNRLDLARWLVSEENPLTARVTVNRWWSEMFGHGIVTTLEDFGIKGELPTHPELLDWLAVDFMEKGWSLKKTLRLIATSATFCQDSTMTPELLERDDPNLLYARGPRFRLDAEGIRDNALAIAGLLSTSKGGPSIRPPQPDGLWKKVGGQQYKYEASPGEQQFRRGIYVVLKRGAPYPSFVNFDASARMACVVKRSRSNTPLQALTLLNDPVYVDAAEAFARRLLEETPNSAVTTRLEHAYRLALARAPSESEQRVLKTLFTEQLSAASSSRVDLPALAAPPKGVSEAEFAAWFSIATAILNLDETITKG